MIYMLHVNHCVCMYMPLCVCVCVCVWVCVGICQLIKLTASTCQLKLSAPDPTHKNRELRGKAHQRLMYIPCALSNDYSCSQIRLNVHTNLVCLLKTHRHTDRQCIPRCACALSVNKHLITSLIHYETFWLL